MRRSTRSINYQSLTGQSPTPAISKQATTSTLADKFVERDVEIVMSNVIDKVVNEADKKTNQRGANRRESHSATNFYTQTHLNIE